jgi:hypothetical protein
LYPDHAELQNPSYILKLFFEGVKVGKSDEPLAGAVIGLFDNGESEFTAENALATVTTEKDGKFIFKDIVYGKYIVAEIESPEVYCKSKNNYHYDYSGHYNNYLYIRNRSVRDIQ